MEGVMDSSSEKTLIEVLEVMADLINLAHLSSNTRTEMKITKMYELVNRLEVELDFPGSFDGD